MNFKNFEIVILKKCNLRAIILEVVDFDNSCKTIVLDAQSKGFENGDYYCYAIINNEPSLFYAKENELDKTDQNLLIIDGGTF